MSISSSSMSAPSGPSRPACAPLLFLTPPSGTEGSGSSSQGSISPSRSLSSGRLSPSYEHGAPASMFRVGDHVVFEMTGSRIEGEVQQINNEECSVQILGTGRAINLPMRRLKPLVFGRITTQVE